MAKKKKKNHPLINPVPREAIADIGGEEDFVDFLRHELDWPIPAAIERFEDIVIPHDLQSDFGFSASEDRIQVSRLLNLTEDQPWGIFLFEFHTKRPYLSHLRRLLRVLGSQRTLMKGNPIWDRNDLLFICTPDWKEFQFVHFSGEKPESALISTFGWKGPDDPFLYTLCKHNLPRLRMPQPQADGGYEEDLWRSAWRDAFSIKPVTDEFYGTLKEVFDAVQAGVKGLQGEDRRFFAELVVNRMVFLKFVEKKGWLDGDRDYLRNRFKAHGRKNYWRNFLCDFFFEGLCKDKDQRSKKVNELLGDVPFLNAELFAPSDKWDDWSVSMENRVFDLLFDKLLNPYNFTVCETSPLDVEVAFNQDLLGYGYEELIADQHGQGAYYTHPTEVNLMCRESLRAYLEGRCPEVNKELIGKLIYAELTDGDSVSEKDALTLYHVLHSVTIVDPALGSGTFPVAMMKHLFLALRTLGGYLNGSSGFRKMIKQDGITDPNDAFALKLHIIERSIYGCDIDYFAVQIAKLRFWIELMVNCEEPEALPNFNCKLLVGDALVSVVGTDNDGDLVTLEQRLGHPTKSSGQSNLIYDIGKQSIEKLATLKQVYFRVRNSSKRKSVEKQIAKTRDDLLRRVGVDPVKINRTYKHILWQFDFAEIFAGDNPGFDIAIANPPYLRQELIDRSLKGFGISNTKKQIIKTYEKLHSRSISSRVDLYVFFFLRSFQLLRQTNGILCFICSNSWLDVGYGAGLREVVSHELGTIIVLDNQVERSFANAAVNTTINLFVFNRKGGKKKGAAFFVLRQPLSHVERNSDFRKTLSSPCDQRTQYFRAISITHERLAETEKWGAFYLKAPDVFYEILEILDSKTTHLENLGKIRRGLTSGCNEFFYLTRDDILEWGLEKKFARPICRGPRDLAAFLIPSELNYYVFDCHENRKKLRGTNALKYIEWGEQQGFHLRRTVSARRRWYDIGTRPASQLCMNHRIHRLMKCYYNQSEVTIGDNFHEVFELTGSSLAAAFLSINSTIVQFWVQVLGRVNFGDGLLEFKGYEINSLPILKPTKASKKRLHMVFEKMLAAENQERATDIADAFFMQEIGLEEKILSELKKVSSELVEKRLSRAGSKLRS